MIWASGNLGYALNTRVLVGGLHTRTVCDPNHIGISESGANRRTTAPAWSRLIAKRSDRRASKP